MATDLHTRAFPAQRTGRSVAGYLIPRNTLLLLMAAQVASVLPHVSHQQVWVWAVVGLCLGWRWMMFRGAWPAPGGWMKAALVVGASLAVAVGPDPIFSVGTATALLLVAFALKLLEMRSRRDAYLVIFLCYFVIATAFLFQQTIALAVFQLVAVLIATGAMIGLNQHHRQPDVTGALRLAAGLMLQAIPLMLVTFLFFPRLAPLWSMPVPGGAETGIADELRPGDVARLARSDQIAFRVVFEGQAPPGAEMYWRGLVFSHYGEGTWRQERMPESRAAGQLGDPAERLGTSAVRYQVLLEPTQAKWVFALDVARPLSAGISPARDFRLVADEPVTRLFRYQVQSNSGTRLDLELPDWLRRRDTSLPPGSNPRARAFAEALRARAASPEAYAAAVLDHIRQAPFHYTLEPPRLAARDDIDAFWFDSRQGFCAHFAGAFVFLMRAAGIPARMVGGYQGGEFNPRTGHLVVRQYDAHAWAEVWFQGHGWVRMDPTASVAPERIARGLEAALSEQDRASLPLLAHARFGRHPVIAGMRNWFESLEHRWNLWVLGYDPQLQARLLADWSPLRIALASLAGAAASAALVGFALLLRRPAPGHPLVAALRRFSRSLRRDGLERRPDETVHAYFTRLQATGSLHRNAAGLLADIEAALYDPELAAAASSTRPMRWALWWLQLRLKLMSRPVRPGH
jgi:protein-glutamine gamma-glutamyltransferase